MILVLWMGYTCGGHPSVQGKLGCKAQVLLLQAFWCAGLTPGYLFPDDHWGLSVFCPCCHVCLLFKGGRTTRQGGVDLSST